MKNLSTVLIVILMVAINSLSACVSKLASFENKQWLLESYDTQSVLEDTEITVLFNDKERNISGSSGCNNYFASYELNGDTLIVFAIASTEMYCLTPAGIMDQEDNYLTLLGKSATFKVEDDRLIIFTADGKTLNYRTFN